MNQEKSLPSMQQTVLCVFKYYTLYHLEDILFLGVNEVCDVVSGNMVCINKSLLEWSK